MLAFHRFRPPIYALCALLLAAIPGRGMAECATPPHDAETIIVRHVHDGDTLILEDERKLRLLGFNTPEIERREHPGEPPGIQARERLIQWIESSGRQIRLQYDVERKDRYGRTLAHAFLKDGHSIAELMLEEGLATSLIIPPNLQHSDCYAKTEQEARAQQRGVWALPSHQPADLEKLRYHRDSYTVLRARVFDLEQNAKGFLIWLGTYENAVRIYIAADDLELFPQKRLKTLAGHQVEVRGWLHHYDKVWTMQLRHPTQFDIL